MVAEAWYRLPGERQWVRIVQQEGPTEEFSDYSHIGDRPGFVLAPFAATAHTPIVVIRPDRITTGFVPEENCTHTHIGLKERTDKAAYTTDFQLFHSKLSDQTFSKIVLARYTDVDSGEAVDAVELFYRACRAYPRQFVALVSTARSGTWLMATPEVLLSGDGTRWRTMALAGTMAADQDDSRWTAKEREEQHVVARYVGQCLSRNATEIVQSGPHTVVAGQLKHLRTDFSFTLSPSSSMSAILSELHPTPAVCGVPKHAAQQFILENEHLDRRYYSGFAGIVGIGGLTSLFVTLRCMEIAGSRCRLYAGGGLMRESTAEQEWCETQAKLNTMKALIQ